MPTLPPHSFRALAHTCLWVFSTLSAFQASAQTETSDPGNNVLHCDPVPLPEDAHYLDAPNSCDFKCNDDKALPYKVGENTICLRCPPPNGGPSQTTTALDSLSLQIGLGSGRNGVPDVGRLLIVRNLPAPGLGSPSSINSSGLHKTQVEKLFVSGALRQLLTPQVFVNIVTINASSYELRFYPATAAGPKSGGLYTLVAGAAASYVIRITSPDGVSHLIVERFEGPNTLAPLIQRSEFTWDAPSRSWHLNRDGQLETLYVEKIYADGSTSGTSDPYLQPAFPAFPLSTNNLPQAVSAFFHGVYQPTEHTLAIETPFGDYLLNLPELPGSGAGTNANSVVSALLGPAGQPVLAQKEVKYYGSVTNAAKVELTLYDVTYFKNVKKPIVTVVDPGGLELVTLRSYIRDPQNPRLHGKLKFQINPDRSWEWHTYDALGRRTSRMTGWLDT